MCGTLNVAAGRLVSLIARLLEPIPVAQPQGEADYAPCIDLDDPMFDGRRDDVVYYG